MGPRRRHVLAAAAVVIGVAVGPCRAAHTDIPAIDVVENAPVAVQRARTWSFIAPSGPLSIESIDREVMEQSGARDVSAVLDMASSALSVAYDGGAGREVSLRGFGDTSVYRNGLNDGQALFGARPLVTVERLEIVKGPSAALFGPGQPGGAINLVTERPRQARAASAAMTASSFGARSFDTDVTAALSRDPRWQYRFVAAREAGDGFRDFLASDRWVGAPALAWQPRADTDILASVE